MPSLKSPSNRLLAALPMAERTDLFRRSVAVDLAFRNVIAESGQQIRHVYFPCTGFLSMLATAENHISLEVALVGNEGMFGVPLALGVGESPLRTIVQGDGVALRMSAGDFRTVLNVSPGLRRVLNRYTHVLFSQLAQVAVCARFHLLEARLARWMLMTHDRASSDTFHYTHELLAEMLGVRRAGVTTAAAALQAKGLIAYSRGTITVLNRVGLEEASCECYAASRDIYKRMFA